jgi:hypothetical protein
MKYFYTQENIGNKDVELQKLKKTKIKTVWKNIELLDSKANIDLSL